MKQLAQLTLTTLITTGFVSVGLSQVLVNDTWQDGTRTDPASPTYSEYGVDADLDGDLESVWYRGGTGTLDPVTTGGPLQGDLTANGTGSGSWTTYFAPANTALTLANVGDQLLVTWKFSLQNVGAENSSQNFRIALVDTPEAARLLADGSPGSSTYAGYGMLNNMGVTLGRTTPFRIVERTDPLTSSALLSSTGSWVTGSDDAAVVGDPGYADNTPYTFLMSLTRTVSGIDVAASMTGGNLGGDGDLSTLYSDATPSTYSYDTFSLRPSSAVGTAQIWDTTLFKVELIVPEPTTFALLGLGGLAFLLRRRS
jgi:hypothetical protein